MYYLARYSIQSFNNSEGFQGVISHVCCAWFPGEDYTCSISYSLIQPETPFNSLSLLSQKDIQPKTQCRAADSIS